jgi:TetR/AcrR family transcriptional repressor of nem operon
MDLVAFWRINDYLSSGSQEATSMNDIKTAIMDSAEKWIRMGGYAAFSFRDVAADVGIRSSSVHYHFPTKENLAVAVIRRYTDGLMEALDQELSKQPDAFIAWTTVFGLTLNSTPHMCPGTVLGSSAQDLPALVAIEVKRFFALNKAKMMASGLTETESSKLLSTLIGAIVVANALDDASEYDRATDGNSAPKVAAAA